MSSGACRALVAAMLTLVATIVMSLPAVAKTDELAESADVIYTVHPSEGTIDVQINVGFQARKDWPSQVWREFIVEQQTLPTAGGPFKVRGRREKPGLWEAIGVRTPNITPGEPESFILQYTLDADVVELNDRELAQVPARINDSYLYFCVTGQDTDVGSVIVNIDKASRWDISRPLGTTMELTKSGFKSTASDNRTPGDIFTCFEAVREGLMETDVLIGPGGREMQLQAWSGRVGWIPGVEVVAPDVLRDLHEFIGHDIPGEGPIIVRMSPNREVGGWASTHDTPGVVQLDETVSEPVHQLAHVWYGSENFTDTWLREGMAEWTAGALAGQACAPTTEENGLGLELSEWMVVQPQSPSNYAELIAAQEAAACGIVAAVRERMPKEIWDDVVGSMLKGETKYIGSAGPEIGASTAVDWREWLDAVDERGLVPAAADATYAGNRDDLDFAQDLVEAFGGNVELAGNDSELALRSEIRAYYHAFLDEIAPLGAPLAVRQDMDDWDFRAAKENIDKSYETYSALSEADRLLPEADLIKIVQPQFEAAENKAELDAVEDLVADLLEGAQEVAGPLGDLLDVLPPGWVMPSVINNAIGDQRFDDIKSAITPAREAAIEIGKADAALPQTGFLQKYKSRFETTLTISQLEELAADAKSDRLKAERAGRALQQLETEVGDWIIPIAVTAPLENDQLEQGENIIADARAVVAAATAADLALPKAGLREEFRPQFEAVTNGAEMAALRAAVEQRAAEAEAVGNALSTLNTLVPTWQIPAIVADPVAAGDFAGAVATAQAAERWITAAAEAQDSLPDLNALESIKEDFENAPSLAALEEGAVLAEAQANAADWVRRAQEKAAEGRDLLTDFGLWGVDVDTIVDEALAAAVVGEVEVAVNKAGEAISVVDGGASAGSLRLAGLVFFGVAVLGVLGLWVMLRRQAGPSWARSSTPHWIEGGEKRGLLGRGRNKDDKTDKKGKQGKKGR